jgi:hypothetical protein
MSRLAVEDAFPPGATKRMACAIGDSLVFGYN